MKSKVVAVLLWTLFLNLFLYHRMGSGATVLVLGGYFFLLVKIFSGWKERSLFRALLVLNALFAWILLSVDSWWPRMVVFLTWAGVNTMAADLFLQKRSFFSDLPELIIAPVRLAWSYVWGGLEVVGNLLKIRGGGRVVLGLILGLPVVMFLMMLLGSGDPIFGHFLKSLFSFNLASRPIVHVIFSLFVLAGFLPLVGMAAKKVVAKIPENMPLATETSVVLALSALVLGIFLIVQWPYVFVNVPAETSLAQFGVATYSEYVKRGFFEFAVVAVTVYGLLWLGLWSYRSARGKWLPTFLQTVLLGEMAIFLLSIFRRIYLYQNLHGWSLARIYGGIFLVWVAGLLVMLAVRHWRQKSLVKAEVVFGLAMVLFVGFFNAEKFVLSNPPTVNKRVDYVYLSRMSTDGYDGWKKSLAFAESVLANRTLWNKPVLNKDDRRDINYSRWIVENLQAENGRLDYCYSDRHGLIDEFFSFNRSSYTAWQRWHQGVPAGKLDELMGYYKVLQAKINGQPEAERDFETDISIDSPFL